MAEMRYIVENVLLLVVYLYLYNAKLNFAEDKLYHIDLGHLIVQCCDEFGVCLVCNFMSCLFSLQHRFMIRNQAKLTITNVMSLSVYLVDMQCYCIMSVPFAACYILW